MLDVRENAILALSSLPFYPDLAAGLGRKGLEENRAFAIGKTEHLFQESDFSMAASISRRRQHRGSVSTLSTMPHADPASGLKGLGLGLIQDGVR